MKAGTQLPHPDREALDLAQVLFALSDPGRLAIVRELADGPQEAAQCTPWAPDMPKGTKSHMMKVLREAGVIRNLPNGRARLLSIRRDDLEARFPGLIDAVLNAERTERGPSEGMSRAELGALDCPRAGDGRRAQQSGGASRMRSPRPVSAGRRMPGSPEAVLRTRGRSN